VRRGFIAEKYAAIVEALYTGQKRVAIEAQVRFEDGRTGMIRAELPVNDAATYSPEAAKVAA
jgi:long-chain acyl-CoA synthetase